MGTSASRHGAGADQHERHRSVHGRARTTRHPLGPSPASGDVVAGVPLADETRANVSREAAAGLGADVDVVIVEVGAGLAEACGIGARAEEFLALQREAREAGRGFWGACGSSSVAPAPVPSTTVARATTTVPIRPLAGGGCHSSYSGTCIPPDVSDADCAGGSGNGPHYVQEKDVQVVGSDPYRLDSDGDGVGCES